jgi:quercetin dioxygenase-like cupin family protein
MQLYRRDDVPEEGVSHNPEIRKRVMVRNGSVPALTNFSQSVFEPGQTCDPHTHPDMFEIYLVEAGRGELVVEGETIELHPGDCAVVEPGEEHSMSNPEGAGELRLTYFGIAPSSAPTA